MNEVLLGVLGYVVAQFAIGAWASRRIATESDFINAGRQLGMVLGSFTVFATWFGAEAIVGTAGQVYENGLSGAESDPFGYAVALIVSGLLFAAALWRRGLVTFADFFRSRYSPAVERLVVILLVPGGMFWAAAQIRAFGQVVSSVSDLDVSVAISVAAVVVVAYTVLGGLMADAVTDLIQGIAVIIGLVALAALAASELGGVLASLAKVEPARLLVLGTEEGGSWLAVVERWAVPVCGTIVAVELVSRILGCRSAEVARRATVLGGVIYLGVGLIPVYLGLVGPQLIEGLTGDAVEQVVPELAGKLLPGLLFVLFAGALISAILSTVDSVLLAAASLISHNIAMRLVEAPTERTKLVSVRVTVVALAGVAFMLALVAQSIRDLVEVASAAGSAGVIVCLVLGLFTRIGGPVSAAAALVSGAGVWLVAFVLELSETPYLFAMGIALVAYLGASLAFREASQVAQDAG
ncbi:MAG: sodium:solute symporter family protein [Pseudomonadota bacterium]